MTTSQEIKITVPDSYSEARKFYDGNHYQNLEGWAGMMPDSFDPNRQRMIENIKLAFRSKNVIKEVIATSLNAILGRNLTWELMPADESDEAIALAEEANKAITEWWRDRKINRFLYRAGVEMKLSKRGLIRVMIPQRFWDKPVVTSLSEALRRIYCHVPSSQCAIIAPYPDSMSPEIGLYTYADERGAHKEMYWLDETGQTVMQLDSQESIFNLGDLMPMYQMEVDDLFISPQLIQQQKSLNFALTMGQKNLEHGYYEMFFINTEPPFLHDERGNIIIDPQTGQPKTAPMVTGPGTRNILIGKTTEDRDGNQTIASPSVVRFEPIPIDVYRGSEEWFYEVMLAECNQLHFLLNGQAVVSGESRRQALQGFLSSLSSDIEEFQLAVRWLLKITLRYAGILMGDPERYADLGVSVTIVPDAGPMSAEERNQLRADYQAGGLSLYGWLREKGYDDPEAIAEMQRITDEMTEKLRLQNEATASAFVGEATQMN